MYEAYFGLMQSPFGLTPDPDFLFFTKAHRDAAAGLVHAVVAKKGFSVVAGDAGTGKTTLLRLLMACVPRNQVHVSFILNPGLDVVEFFQMALYDFGVSGQFTTKGQCLTRFHQLLLDIHAAGKIALLIIDDAHRMSHELLEEVRLLTKFETDKEKLLQIVLAGQDELNEVLDSHGLRQLKQLIAMRFSIPPLTVAEVRAYIEHRWAKAGSGASPFLPESVAQIAAASCGIPRLVNVICENALVLAFANEDHSVRAKYIEEVVRDLRLNPAPAAAPRPAEGATIAAPRPAEAATIAAPVRELPGRIAERQTEPAEEMELLPTLGRYMPSKPWRVRLSARFGRRDEE